MPSWAVLLLLAAAPARPAAPSADSIRYCAFGARGEGVAGELGGFSLAGLSGLGDAPRPPDAPIPIVDDGSVSAAARDKARAIVSEMLARSPSSLRARLGTHKVFLVIIPHDKKLTDLPQFRSLRGVKLPDGRTWDEIRGVGFVSQPDSAIAVGVGEENLLSGAPRDGYPKGYLLAHELGHAVHGYGFDAASARKVAELYKDRRERGLPFASAYASTDEWEYFAVSANVFFQLRLGAGPEREKDSDWVRREDPSLYGTLGSAFGESRPLWPEPLGLFARELAQPAVQRGLTLLGLAPRPL